MFACEAFCDSFLQEGSAGFLHRSKGVICNRVSSPKRAVISGRVAIDHACASQQKGSLLFTPD